ncbi:MAG: glutamate 5-kinase [Deltaproteobacteria bacterium]|jgi:glutamate 5-kinase|nr:glutamate 5-kinase [Deltaproteobacteria bacterium]
MPSERDVARRAQRIVVKIGSGVLANGGALQPRVLGAISRQVGALLDEGREVVLVSSGAIAVGSRVLGWEHPGRSIPEKQAAAAVGQIGLAEMWRKRMARYDRAVGQVLVTRAGLEDRERFLNARHTLLTLLELGAVPVVNENDTVATEEIRFGDNDNLSATVVNLVGADLLVILTDVEGLYESPPEPGQPLPPRIDVVERITPKIRRAAGGSESAFGRGGMITKLEAARSAAHGGAATVICNGRRKDILSRVAAGESVGTLFRAGNRLASRKHWLAFTARPRGRLALDAGAVRAVRERGRSLLPAGVVRVDGQFGIGDPISCLGPDGAEFARGLTAYSATEIEQIKGQQARRITSVLGYSNGDEVVHRDDLVLLEGPVGTGSTGTESTRTKSVAGSDPAES